MIKEITQEIRDLFRLGTKFKVFLGGKKYAEAKVIWADAEKQSISLELTNDKGQSTTDTFIFDSESDKPGWLYCDPNNFYGSALGGPKYFVTEQKFEFSPVL